MVATATMVLVVLLLQGALPTPPFVRLVASAGVGAALYAAVAWVALGRRLPRALLSSAPASRFAQQPGLA